MTLKVLISLLVSHPVVMWDFMSKSRPIRQQNIYTRSQDSPGVVRFYFLRVKEKQTTETALLLADVMRVPQGLPISLQVTSLVNVLPLLVFSSLFQATLHLE